MNNNKLLSLDELNTEPNRQIGLSEYIQALHNAGVVVLTMFSTHKTNWGLSKDNGVRLHHVPSGIGVQVDRSRNQYSNLVDAYKMLLKLVEEGKIDYVHIML